MISACNFFKLLKLEIIIGRKTIGITVNTSNPFFIVIITQAIKRGDLKPGMKMIEPTSGNTGIALAMIAALKGYQIELIMPENATRERVLTMEAFGAKVILTPKDKSMEGAIDYALEKVGVTKGSTSGYSHGFVKMTMVQTKTQQGTPIAMH